MTSAFAVEKPKRLLRCRALSIAAFGLALTAEVPPVPIQGYGASFNFRHLMPPQWYSMYLSGTIQLVSPKPYFRM